MKVMYKDLPDMLVELADKTHELLNISAKRLDDLADEVGEISVTRYGIKQLDIAMCIVGEIREQMMQGPRMKPRYDEGYISACDDVMNELVRAKQKYIQDDYPASDQWLDGYAAAMDDAQRVFGGDSEWGNGFRDKDFRSMLKNQMQNMLYSRKKRMRAASDESTTDT